MAWSAATNVGTDGNKTSQSSFTTAAGTLFNASVPVGAVLRVVVATDNIATTSGTTNTHTGVTDSKGNTYTKLIEWTVSPTGAAGDGATVSVWVAQVANALTNADNLSVTFSGNVAAKNVLAQYRTVGAGNTWQLDGANGAGGTGTTPSVTLSGLSAVQRLWIGALAAEGTATVTEDADYASAQTRATSGGSAASNMRGHSASRVATLSSDTYNPTLSATSDWAAVLVALQEVTGTEPKSASDTPTISVDELADVAVILSPSDDPALSVGEAQSSLLASDPSEAPTVSVGEAQSSLLLSSPSDAPTLSVAEGAQVAALLTASDAPALAVSEASAVVAGVQTSDAPAVATSEAQSSLVASDVTDEPVLSVGEVQASLLVSGGSDDPALSVGESAQVVPMGAEEKSASDGPAISVSEDGSVLASSDAADDPAVSVGESVSLLVSSDRADAPAISVLDAQASLLASSISDALAVSVSEAALFAVVVPASDAPTLAVDEASAVMMSEVVWVPELGSLARSADGSGAGSSAERSGAASSTDRDLVTVGAE